MRIGTPGFVGARLTQARLVQHRTMKDLAQKINLSPQIISAYEKGLKTPHPSVLWRLAFALNVPDQFFLTIPVGGDKAGPICFRSMAAATKRARDGATSKIGWLREIRNYFSEIIILPELNVPDVKVARDPLKISNKDIEDAATECRRHWGLGDGPISDLVLLLENNGFVMALCELGTVKLDALSTLPGVQGDAAYVLLGSDRSTAPRLRFDAGHECGHVLLHNQLGQAHLQRSAEFKQIELQAHRFASALLFPRPAFLEEVLIPSLDRFVALKKKWKVSVKMMIVRAYQLNLLGDREYTTMLVNYNRRGWNRLEPFDNELSIERPRLLRKCVDLATERNIFSLDQLQAALPFGTSALEELIGLPDGYLSNREPVVNFPDLVPKAPKGFSQRPDSRVVPFPGNRKD